MVKNPNLVYGGGQYYGKLGATQTVAAKELVSEVAVAFAPFVPFTRAFELELRERAQANILAPPDPQNREANYMNRIVGYEKATQDPEPKHDPINTMDVMEGNPGLRNAAVEIARLLRNESVFAYDKSDTTRGNKRYVGEVAYDVVARDVFDKLPASYKSGEKFDIDMADELVKGHSWGPSFDLGLKTLESKKALTTMLAQMKEAGVDQELLNRVGGAEITIAKSKSMQDNVNQLIGDGLSTQQAFANAAQQFVSDLNADLASLRGLGLKLKDLDKISKNDLEKGGYGMLNALEINQALRRLSDILAMDKQWGGKDTYIYQIPLHNKGGFFGHGYAFISINNKNDWNKVEWVISEMIIRESMFQIAGGPELQLLEDLADMMGLAEGGIIEQWEGLMTLLGEEYVLGIMEGTKIPAFFETALDISLINSIAPRADIVQTMTTKQLGDALILAMSDVAQTAAPHVARQIEKIYNRANNLSKVWKSRASDAVWDGAINKYNFSNPDNKRAGVWAPIDNHWVGGVGQGFAVSPMLAQYKQQRSYDTFKKLLGKGNKW